MTENNPAGKGVSRRAALKTTAAALGSLAVPGSGIAQEETAGKLPFGEEFPKLDSLASGEWWLVPAPKGELAPPPMDVPRDEVVAFAIYTQDAGVLKLTAQLYPLKPGEPREVRLELREDGVWWEAARVNLSMPGWSAHFRLTGWNGSKTVPYRVRHGEKAQFGGVIRRDPIEKEEIVIANMSCNSSRTTGQRPEILDQLKAADPDLLFFAGDQTYRHTQHTAGWIEFGLQFKEVLRDRPAVCIPDDHDVGHPNLWGENGKRSVERDNSDGGYFYPVEYVNMVQRQQSWSLPDPVDPAPVERGITVYFTRLRVGGVDFAIMEDRKFKSGPKGKIPQMGPRPDHINDPAYDPATVDLPGLELLGGRQEKFLEHWGQDWTGAEMKVVLSQTAFCGAVHMHGAADARLLADLDCNGWPQTPRKRALRSIRRASAIHLCGDQHLAVVAKQGIDTHTDGPFSFTSPALVNTIYGRWWHPLDEQAGPNAVPGSPLPWTGDFKDGLGNPFRMLAYANPPDIEDERRRGDGYGIVRFRRKTGEITFECWPRFPQGRDGTRTQFPGWPVTVSLNDNDGRMPSGHLPELVFEGVDRPVVQVLAEADGEVLYTLRLRGNRFRPPVFGSGKYTVKAGRDRPDGKTLSGLEPAGSGEIRVTL